MSVDQVEHINDMTDIAGVVLQQKVEAVHDKALYLSILGLEVHTPMLS